MLRWIALVVVVVALAGVMTFMSLNATVADAKPKPVVVVSIGPAAKLELSEPPTFEFGTMPQLSGGKHTWEIKNVGEVDLELTLGSTTCSCTIAKLKSSDGVTDKPKLVVKPHDSTKVDVEWQTKTFRDDYSQGVTLTTNDPVNQSVSIKVHGTVHPPVIIVPKDTINFGSVPNEEPQQERIAVFSMDRPDTKVTKLTSSRPEFLVPRSQPFSANDCKMLKCKGGHWVIVDMKPGMPLGRFQDEVVIETDHPLKSDLKLVIMGNATGPISVIPDRVRMPSVSSSQGASRDISLLVRGGKPTKFEVIRHPEKLNVTIAADDTSTQKGRYKMTVTVPPGTSAGPVDGEIVLKTDHPRAAEMKIQVTVLISNSGA